MLALRRTLVTALIAVTASVCAQAPAAAPAEGTKRTGDQTTGPGRQVAARWSSTRANGWCCISTRRISPAAAPPRPAELRDNIFAFRKARCRHSRRERRRRRLAREIRQGTQPAVRHPRRPDARGVKKYGVLTTYGTAELCQPPDLPDRPRWQDREALGQGGSEGSLGHGARRRSRPIQRTRRRPKPADIHRNRRRRGYGSRSILHRL